MNTARLNYGNGQVHYFSSVAAARRELAELKRLNVDYTGFMFIQKCIDGVWVRA